MWAAASSRADGAVAARGHKVAQVQLDGLVLLKIVKHCKENFPEYVAGALLGLDVDDTLQVTHSYPTSAAVADADDYDLDMLKALRKVNVDNNSVGWYQSTFLGSYCTKDTILHQFEYQESLPNSVVLIYDSVRTVQGQLAIKALRLTDQFCDAHRSKRITAEGFAALSPSQIFEELPIRVHNSHLVQALLLDLLGEAPLPLPVTVSAAAPGAAPAAEVALGPAAAAAVAGPAPAAEDVDVEFKRLDLTTAPFLERHLEFMADVTDGLLHAHVESMQYQRRVDEQRRKREEWLKQQRAENDARRARGEEPVPIVEDPSLPFNRPIPELRGRDPLDVLLMSAQVSNYCAQVNSFAGQSFGKIFLAGSLHGGGAAK